MKALEFTGRGGEYFRIWIVNILLSIVTLSIYHPWAKVRDRRYFLGNTTLEGRGFDYHATGRQLLPGHLIVMVLVLSFVALQAVFPVAGLVLAAVLALATPWIIWRSLSFNARMTSFSTVRFGFEGTAGGAYVSYLLWPLLLVAAVAIGPAVGFLLARFGEAQTTTTALIGLVASLAGYALVFLAYVKVKKRQTRYTVGGHRYGQGRFTNDVRGRGFAKILLKTIGLGLLMLVGLVALVALFAFATGVSDRVLGLAGKLDDPEAIGSMLNDGAVQGLLVAIYVGALLLGLLAFAYSHTRQRAYVFGRTRLDDTVALASTLGARRFAWVLLSNLLLVAVTLGLATPWAKTRLARTLVEHTEVDTGAGFDAYVSQKRSEQSSLGDQIGDAFDVDVGVGF